MKTFFLLAVLLVVGWGLALMIGQAIGRPQLHRQYWRWVGRGVVWLIRGFFGLLLRFGGFLIRVVGGGIPRFVGRHLEKAGRRISP